MGVLPTHMHTHKKGESSVRWFTPQTAIPARAEQAGVGSLELYLPQKDTWDIFLLLSLAPHHTGESEVE